MSKLLQLPAIAFSLATTSMVANAADIAVPPPLIPLQEAPFFSWTGLYLGGSVGGVWHQSNLSDSLFGVRLSGGESFIGGDQLGLNYQIGAFVLGIEGDFDWAASSRTGSAVVTPVGTVQATANDTWIATLAARFGAAFDHWLLYGKAGGGWVGNVGFAINNSTSGMSIAGLNGNTTANLGWLAGAGVEWAMTGNCTLRIEYDYLGLPTSAFTVPATAPFFASDTFTASNRNIQMVQVGLNYLFKWDY